MKANRIDAYELMHDGVIAFSDMEANGIRIDEEYCHKQMGKLEIDISNLQEKIHTSKVCKRWKRVFGSKFNLDSNPQLAHMLFKKMGYEPTKLTEGGNPSVDQSSLESLDIPFVKKLLKLRKFKKAKSTYLGNIMRETVDGFVHPFFNLHTARTYRGSCNNINFQNQPVRDPELMKMIRRCFIPRKNRMLVEIDYSGLEVCISVCYHKDPVLMSYVEDKTKDMHRDMAKECYRLKEKQVSKDIRYCSKNKFIFPQFYGSYWKQCAKALWEAVDGMKLATTDDIPLGKHLKSKGLKSLSQFEKHIEKVEDRFWNKRFKVYADWKDRHYARYVKKGYFDTLTGFRCSGLMSRNDAINYPIQGSAFHCLLWSLIELNNFLKENDFDSVIVGQIHDSIVLDVVPKELDRILHYTKKIMEVSIKKHWKWIIVPLGIDVEVTPVNGSWAEMKEMKDVAVS